MEALRPLSITAVAALLRAPPVPIPSFVGTGREVGGRRGKSVRAGAGGGGWLSGLLGRKGGGGAPTAMTVTPGTVKAGDPVLHEPAQEVSPGDVPSEKIQGIIDQMIAVMRKAPGVGLAAPQIGVPLKVLSLHSIVLLLYALAYVQSSKDSRYIAQPVKFANDRLLFWRTPKNTSAMLPRRTSMRRIAAPLIFLWVYYSVLNFVHHPLLLLGLSTFSWLMPFYVSCPPLSQVVINPKLRKTSKRTARFYEGCLRYLLIYCSLKAYY